MLLADLVWKTFHYPLVTQGLEWSYSLLGVPYENSREKIGKVGVAEEVCEKTSLRLDLDHVPVLQGRSVLSEIHVSPLGALVEGRVRLSDNLSYQSHLLVFILTTKDGITEFKLGCHATEGPHVYFRRVVVAENDLWSSIVPRLDVGIELLVAKAA